MRKILSFTVIMVAMMLAAVPAFAATGAVIPHGGYSATTDSCLQCHDIHEAAGDYVLMRHATVTATCGSCHTLYQAAPSGAYDPGFPGVSAGVSAPDMAYNVPLSQALTHAGHRLGLGTGTFTFADGATGDGSYIPGGTQALTAIRYLSYPATTTALAFRATNGLHCASCHTPHGTFGNMVPAATNPHLLSSRPNHGASVTIAGTWTTGGADWCGACHDQRVSGRPDLTGAVHHNHPDSTCLTCHGDTIAQVGLPASADFPHSTTADMMLTLTPDVLCLQCHASGTLP